MKIIIITLVVLAATLSFSEENQNLLIPEIIADIDNYQNRTVEINLRLKYVDRIFEKIVFYDAGNVDIEFDIAGKEKRKELAISLINIHEGMMYRVRFTVIGSGALGGLAGNLHEFTPVFLDKLPIE